MKKKIYLKLISASLTYNLEKVQLKDGCFRKISISVPVTFYRLYNIINKVFSLNVLYSISTDL